MSNGFDSTCFFVLLSSSLESGLAFVHKYQKFYCERGSHDIHNYAVLCCLPRIDARTIISLVIFSVVVYIICDVFQKKTIIHCQ